MVYDIKQYIICCPGGWTKGKISAQISHASMAIFFQRMSRFENTYCFKASEDEIKWIEGPFAKITLKANNRQQLVELGQLAEKLQLQHALIFDNGATQKDDEAATLAIGPFDTNKIEYASMISKLSEFKLY